jgi:small-conductance mechanosensitive channel
MNGLDVWLTNHLVPAIRIASLGLFGLALIHVLARAVSRAVGRRFGSSLAPAAGSIVRYVLGTLVLLSVLHELGFNLNAWLGAAGVAGIAIGFAAQTSLSNIISGAFLVWERPFRPGDLIEIDTVTGHVHAVDLLATYVRTPDNRLVRIPNEALVKTRVTNVTRFPLRRLDLAVSVAPGEDAERVTRALLDAAADHPACLDDPAPSAVLHSVGPASMDFVLSAWFVQRDAPAARDVLLRNVRSRLEREGIVRPAPAVVPAAEAPPRPA